MSLALGARPLVNRLLQASSGTSMCRHKYNWNIDECDVTLPVQPNHFIQHDWRTFYGCETTKDIDVFEALRNWAHLKIQRPIANGISIHVYRQTKSIETYYHNAEAGSWKLIEIVFWRVYYVIPFGLSLFLALFGITFHLFNCFVRIKITSEDSIPEMRIWSILFINPI